MIFVERVLDDTPCAGRLQARDDVPHDRLVEDRVDVDPLLVGQAGDRRLLQRRQQRQHLLEPLARHVHHQPDFALGRHRAAEHQHDVVDLLPLPGVGVGFVVGDEPRRALQQFGEDAQVVGPQRAAGLGHFDDGVGQLGRLDFGGAPTELDLGLHAVPGQIAFGQADDLGGDPFAFQVLDGLELGELVRHASTQRTGRRLTLVKTSSATSCTLASFSRIQS